MSLPEFTTTCDFVVANPDGESYHVAGTGEPFDAELYSRLKYGSLTAARQMGRRLGHQLVDEYPDFTLGERPVEAVSIYKAQPPACDALSRFCLDVINAERVPQGLEPCRIVKLHKSSNVGFEYAASGPEARESALATFTYDADGHSFTDKNVLVVDDIRITGTAERRTRQDIVPHNPHQLAFGYIAQFEENVGMKDAAVEDRINHTYVKSLNEVLQIILTDDFVLNIRTLKRILSDKEAPNREAFLNGIGDGLLYEIYSGALASGHDFLKDYQAGFAEVTAHARDRKLI